MNQYWIIKDKQGKIALHKIYDSEESARYEFVAHPQYFNDYPEPDPYYFDFIELKEK